MLNKIIIVFLFALPVVVNSQPSELFSIDGKYSITGVDVKGNSYLIQKNTLYKFDQSGQQLFNFSDNNYGNISHVNVSNPLKITVLYADRGLLVLLDNTLSPIGSVIHLHKIGIEDPVVSCSGDDNGFWVYDTSSGKFSFIHWNGQLIFQSLDVRRMFTNAFFPNDLVIFSGNVLSFSNSSGAIMLDNAGNVIQKIPARSKMNAVGPNGVYILESDKINVIEMNTMSESSLFLNTDGMQKISLNFPFLLVQYEKKISLYLLTAQ